MVLSNYTTKDQYNKAIDTIPSDTACYPAKAVHGHIRDLAEAQVDLIWYPCIQHGPKEFSRDNNYHCPMVNLLSRVNSEQYAGCYGGNTVLCPILAISR